MHDIKGKVIRGGLARLCGQLTVSALRLGFLIALARLLEPSAFGLVAMVTVVTATLELLTTAGLSSAAVQRATITDEQISTLFWVNILVGALLAALCVVIAPILVAFYHEPRLFWITAVTGLGFMFSAAGVQHNVLLQRQLRYVAVTSIELLSQFTAVCAGIIMALTGFDYWALVGAAVVLPATMTVCSWIVTGWIPGAPRWSSETYSMLRFGGTVTLNGVVVYFAYNFDKMLLGRVWGPGAVGIYGTASQIINVPTHNLNKAVGSVAFSALSRLQHDTPRYRGYFLKGYAIVMSMTLPITVFSAVFAEDIISVVLGPNWMAAVPIFRLLTPTILVFGMIDPLAWLLLSSGRQMRSLHLSLAIAVLVITSYFIGLPYGPTGVAAAFSTAMSLWLVPNVIWCVHGTPVSVWDVFRTVGKPLVSAVVAVAIAFTIGSHCCEFQTPMMRLLVEGGLVFVIYSFMLLFVMGQKDAFSDLLRSLKESPGLKTKQLESAVV